MPQPSSSNPVAARRADPFVSVVMPVRNEADFIATSLGAVLGQDYPHDRLEVLVADGMSTDATRAIIERAAAASDVPVTIVDNEGRIAPTGLNAAVRRACGEIVVRVDGHCRIASDYVSRCVAHLRRSAVDGVGGPIRTRSTTTTGRAIAAAMSSRFGVGDSAFRTGTREPRLVDTIAFPAYTRAAIELAGPFDEELVRNQDDEYNCRLRKLGGRLLLAPDVRSEYYSRATLASLARQYFQYGFYKIRVLQRHPRQMRTRQFVPAALVVGMMLAPVAIATSNVAKAAVAAIGAAYVGAVAVMALRIGVRDGLRELPALIAAFPILHVAYGTGFLVGLPYWGLSARRQSRSGTPRGWLPSAGGACAREVGRPER